MNLEHMKNTINRRPDIPAILFFIGMGVILCIVIAVTETQPHHGSPPSTQLEQDGLRGVSTVVGLIGLLAILAVRRWVNIKPLRFLLKASAVTLVVFAGVSYFYTTRSLTRRHYLNFHDAFHYFLGCKYIEETGYNEFYNCYYKALKEREDRRYTPNMRIRNLHDYGYIRIKHAVENADCSKFSKARWEAFKTDSTLFADFLSDGATRDHGYNGTPLSAAVFGFVANIPKVTYENLVYLTFFDLFALSILFAVFTWGFGWRMGLLAALFHFVNFGDYYYHVSFFRYWWWVTLGVGITCLHKEKHGIAALFLVASAMLNVFPVLFIGALGIRILYTTVKERRLAPLHRTFLIWSVIGAIAFGGISLTNRNPIEQYEEFFDNMEQHSGLLTGTRAGFRYNFLFQGVTGEDFLKNPVNIREKYHRNRVAITISALLLLGLFSLLIVRLDDAQAAIIGGFALLFFLFSTVRYYYALAPLLLLLWVNDIKTYRGILLCALLFFMMSVVHLAWWRTTFSPFVTNTLYTAMFTLYLGVIFVVLGKRSGLFSSLLSRMKPAASNQNPA